jgi:hypothetical protein
MLRPTRHPSRAVLTAWSLLAILATIWPAPSLARTAAIDRAVTAELAPGAGEIALGLTKDGRAPRILGLGVQDPDASRGSVAGKHLQTLGAAQRDRGVATSRTPRAPSAVTVAPAPTQATSSGQPAAASIGWTGIDQTTQPALPTPPPSGVPVEPPDPWVAVGPNHVVQTVNSMIRMTNREGTSVRPDEHLYDFFRMDDRDVQPLELSGVANPHFYYDQLHSRWLGAAMAWHCATGAGGDQSAGFIYVALSTTADPTGDYYVFVLIYPSFADDPAIGTSSDKVVISATEYDFASFEATNCLDPGNLDLFGSTIVSTDWAELQTFPFEPTNYYNGILPDPASNDPRPFAARPAFSPSGSSSTVFGIYELPTDATHSDVGFFNVTGNLAAGTTNLFVRPATLTASSIVSPFAEPPTPVDPGGPVDGGGVSAIDRRPTDASWFDNVLTFTSTYPCDPAGGGAETPRDCARVTQLSTANATNPTLVQDVLLATTGKDTWMPGAAVSQAGALHIVYTQSGTTEGMSSYHRYQRASDAANTISASVKIGNGAAVAYLGSRWGNYAGIAQDPRDTNAVWQGAQYTKSDGKWATNVSELQTAGSTFVPISPIRLLDSRINLGTTGSFTANLAKTIDIAGRLGIPDDAVAITGNITVTGQQASGFVAVTPVAVNFPATSTMNFPFGDTRANNLITPLGPDGGVGVVFRSGSAGKTAHFILDVTGYYLNDDTGQTYNTLTPVRVLDTRPGAGNVGGITGPIPQGTNQTFQVAGVLGIPSNAKAITGNLTVTGQTSSGYLALTTDPPAGVPTTSTLNFPAGDTRANGVTIKLSSTGKLSVYYKAPTAGQTTQVLLDVTGYYRDDLAGARFIPINPGRRMDTRIVAPAEGLAGAFSANIARTLVIEPYEGVPNNAVAIAGNLTVVGQTSRGFVAITTTATNNPTTSTLNFPLGDIRANGVVQPLAGDGSVGLVYETSSNTGTTHLLLDLTGYFR